MKTIYFLFIVSIFSLNAISQSRISFSAGVKLVEVNTGKIDFWYVDESPSRDNIYKQFELNGNISVNLGVRWIADNNNKLYSWTLGGQGYFGAVNGLDLDGGLVFTGRDQYRSFKLQPEFNIVIGYCWKGIGTIENNDTYIQVNNTKFKDYTNVSVRMINYYYGIKPGIGMQFLLPNSRYIGLKGTYHLSVKSPSIGFNGKNEQNESVSDIESLNEDNIGFYIEGSISNKIPINPDGFEVKLTYGF